MYQGIPPNVDTKFLGDLKRYDRKLNVIFSREAERFVIVRERAWGPPFQLFLVENEDGSFRQPDNRDIFVLAISDLWKNRQEANDRIRDGENAMQAYQEKEERDQRDEFRAIARDNKIQLKNTYRKASNQGSKAPEFRRINVGGRGLTLDQIKQARAAGADPWAGQQKVA